MLLCSILIITSFSGCVVEQQQEPKVVYVPQKCVPPDVDEPVIDNTQYTNNKDIVAKAIMNYEAMKKYSEKLLASKDVCK
jgi:hypothetical protein